MGRIAVKEARKAQVRRLLGKIRTSEKLGNSSTGDAALSEELGATKSADPDTLSARVLAAKLAKLKLIPPLSKLLGTVGELSGGAWPADLCEKFPLLRALPTDSPVITEGVLGAGAETSESSKRAIARITSAESVSKRCAPILQKIQRALEHDTAASEQQATTSADTYVDSALSKPGTESLTGSGYQLGPKELLSRDWSGGESDDASDIGDESDEGSESGDETDDEVAEKEGAGDPLWYEDERWDALVASGSEGEGGESDSDESRDGSVHSETAKLPALAGGFVGKSLAIGKRKATESLEKDYDSDGESIIDDDAADGRGVKGGVKKNRRGQRARKA